MPATRLLAMAALLLLVGAPPALAGADDVLYRVQSGDSLSRIALRVYGDASAWPVIHAANRERLDDPDVIRVGQRLRIPDVERAALDQSSESRGEVRLVSGDAYPPYAGRSLYRAGLTTEIVQRAFERAGYEVALAYREWAEGYAAARQGEFDGTFPYLANPRRRGDFSGLVSQPLTTVLVRIFTRADADFTYRAKADLHGRVACRPRGYFTHDLDPLLEDGHIDLLRTDSVAACFERLADGRVDFVPVNRFTAAAAVERAGLEPDAFAMARRPLHRDTLHLLISPRTPSARERLSDFKEALAAMRAQGTLRALRNEHIARYRGSDRAGPWVAAFGATPTEPDQRQAGEAGAGDSGGSDGGSTEVEKSRGDDDAAATPDQRQAGEAGAGDSGGSDGGSAETDSAPAEAAGIEPWHLVSGPDYSPFADPDLPAGGMTAEIVRRAAGLMDQPVEVVYRSWEAGYEAAAAGDTDGAFPYVATALRQRDFALSKPLYSMPVMLFARAGSGWTYTGLNDLRGRVACKAAGYYREDIQDPVAAGFVELVEAPTLAECFRRLGAGRVDFVTANRYTGQATIRRLDDYRAGDFRMLERPIAEVDLHLMIPEALISTYSRLTNFDDALEELRASGELQAIQERHMEAYRARQ